MATLLLATGNPGKVAEFRALLAQYLDLAHLQLLTPRDWPYPLPEAVEIGRTFAENARLKAEELSAVTGLPTLADDSGLCVEALGGAPGLYSARWAGLEATDADRNAKLLEALAERPGEPWTARFVCTAAFAVPGEKTVVAEAFCEGVILPSPRGTQGFGYDPLFLIPALGRTMAELTPSEKNRISHRALAIAQLAPVMARALSTV
jgi:XTP/dITP diphosphohydrolase